MHKARTSIATLALVIAFTLVPSAAFAWTVQTTSRSVNDIRIRWQSAQPDYSGTAYQAQPSVASPYAAGSLQPAFLDDGLSTLNFVRYLAGLPDDVVLDPTLSSYDQKGTVVLAANNVLSHYPAQPAGMAADFYTAGKTGTSSSNIAHGPVELETAIKMYMADNDAHNINGLGHRRWILNPAMAKTGMGQTSSFSAMWALDKSRTGTVSYNTVQWPAAGQFPVEFFKAGTPWSVSLNPAKYSVDPAGLVVTMRRVGDGRTWTFNSTDAYTAGQTFDREIFNYSTNGYGIPSCVVFRPELATSYNPGDEFDVTIGGTLYAAGTSTRTTVAYRTSFFTLNGPILPASRIALSAPAAITYSTATTLCASLTDTASAALDGRTIAFEASVDGGSSWFGIGSGTTDAGGNVSAPWRAWKVRRTMLVRARFAGDAGISGSAASRTVTVRPYIAFTAPTRATRLRAFAVYGYLGPRHTYGTYAATVRMYKRVSGRWVYKSSARARVVYNSATTSRLRAAVALPAGTWMLKLYHPADAANVAAYSPARIITVR